MGSMGTTQEQAAEGTALGVYLPRLQSSILKPAGGNTSTTISLDPDAAQGLTPAQASGYSITVAPDSLVGMDGQKMSSGMVGFSTVAPALIRPMLPQGVMQLATTLTIQAPGVATFSTPLQVTFANVYGAAPGSQLSVYSFNHTTGMLEITGTATVSADGKTATTDPGSGITHPGWFGVTPGTPTMPCDPNRPSNPSIPPVFDQSGLQDRFYYKDDQSEFDIQFTNAQSDPNGDALVVQLTVDGPSESFLVGLPSGETDFTLWPRQQDTIKVELSDLSALIPTLIYDQIYAVDIHVKAFAKSDPSNVLYDSHVGVVRWLGVVDPMAEQRPLATAPTDVAVAFFLPTLADGVGKFVRTKFLQYHLPAKVMTGITDAGDDQNTFNLSASSSLHGEGMFQWEFDPSQAGEMSGLAQITIGQRPMSQGVTLFGIGKLPTTIDVGENTFISELTKYLTDQSHYNDGQSTPLSYPASEAFISNFQQRANGESGERIRYSSKPE